MGFAITNCVAQAKAGSATALSPRNHFSPGLAPAIARIWKVLLVGKVFNATETCWAPSFSRLPYRLSNNAEKRKLVPPSGRADEFVPFKFRGMLETSASGPEFVRWGRVKSLTFHPPKLTTVLFIHWKRGCRKVFELDASWNLALDFL